MRVLTAKAGFRCALALLLVAGVGVGLTFGMWPGKALGQGAARTQSKAAKDDDDDKKESGAKAKGGKPAEPHSKRWHISWAVDEYAAKMDVKPVPTSIAHLVTFKRPADLPKDGNGPVFYRTKRVPKIETVLWSVTGTIVGVAAEHDGDYRLKISDGKGSEVICVMPDPALAPVKGRFAAKINAVRAAVVAKFHPTFDERKVNVRATVVGFGYFGRLSPDENPSPEGFQLHPGISLRFIK